MVHSTIQTTADLHNHSPPVAQTGHRPVSRRTAAVNTVKLTRCPVEASTTWPSCMTLKSPPFSTTWYLSRPQDVVSDLPTHGSTTTVAPSSDVCGGLSALLAGPVVQLIMLSGRHSAGRTTSCCSRSARISGHRRSRPSAPARATCGDPSTL